MLIALLILKEAFSSREQRSKGKGRAQSEGSKQQEPVIKIIISSLLLWNIGL